MEPLKHWCDYNLSDRLVAHKVWNRCLESISVYIIVTGPQPLIFRYWIIFKIFADGREVHFKYSLSTPYKYNPKEIVLSHKITGFII